MLFEPGEEAPEFDFKKSDLDYMQSWEVPLRVVFTVLLLFHIGIQVKQILNDDFVSHFKQT